MLSLGSDFSISISLKSRGHRTIRILYYFKFKPGVFLPTSKVYILAKHYGINDLEITQGLSRFFKA